MDPILGEPTLRLLSLANAAGRSRNFWSGLRIAAALAIGPFVLTINAIAADDQRLLTEACSLVSQQRNSLSDAIAVSEARSKIAGEEAVKVKQRVTDWEAYFRAYVGEPAAETKP